MTIERKLLGTTPVSGEVLPEAVSFDGSNDHLKRSTELTGNAVGKMFTFSAWFYFDGSTTGTVRIAQFGSFNITCGSDGTGFHIDGYPTSGNPAFYADWVAGVISKNQWNHVLISIDVTGANTAKRHVYLNDVNFTTSAMGFDSWYDGSGWFNDVDINFLGSPHYIGGNNSHSIDIKGRLAHVYLDKTYRDLSTTSNRRLFIDAEGKPSSTIPSSPIVHIPMTDAATAGSNSGTGGDYAVVGILATAERGPNQDNCSASTFDGSNDYLTFPAGFPDSGTFTFAWSGHAAGGYGVVGGANGYFAITLTATNMQFTGYNSSSVKKFKFSMPVDTKRHSSYIMSFDLSDTGKRHVFVDGVDKSSTVVYDTYLNDTVWFSRSGGWTVFAESGGTGKLNGSAGEFYFDSAYIDLATDNPFWDSTANQPTSLRKVIADTGTTPQVALPISGNDAGNNLGSAADFTVNSGPFVGARGGSEFWARSVEGTGSSGISLTRGAMSGGASSPNLTVVFSVYLDSRNSQKGWFGCGGNHFLCYNDSGGNVFIGNAFADSVVTISNSSSPFSTGSWHTVLWSMVSNGTSSQRHIYVDGVSASNQTWVQTRSTFDLTGGTSGILSDNNGSQNLDGKIAGLYIDQTYTDFSQESNRNKFIDQLGYPIDLGADGSEPTGSSPLVYMKFDNTASFGTNVGTGGNYTVNGAVTSGADFTP